MLVCLYFVCILWLLQIPPANFPSPRHVVVTVRHIYRLLLYEIYCLYVLHPPSTWNPLPSFFPFAANSRTILEEKVCFKNEFIFFFVIARKELSPSPPNFRREDISHVVLSHLLINHSGALYIQQFDRATVFFFPLLLFATTCSTNFGCWRVRPSSDSSSISSRWEIWELTELPLMDFPFCETSAYSVYDIDSQHLFFGHLLYI